VGAVPAGAAGAEARRRGVIEPTHEAVGDDLTRARATMCRAHVSCGTYSTVEACVQIRSRDFVDVR